MPDIIYEKIKQSYMAVGMGINMNIGQINKVIDTEDKNINKNSKSDNNNNDEAMDSREAIAKYLNGVKEYISKITDPLNGMTDEQKERYKQKVLRLIESGKKLNSQQMAYVKKYMHEMYPYVLRIQLKRKAFEESLKHCKSKEEANDIYNRNLSEVNSDEPMAKAMIAAYDDAMKTFKKSDMYKALPDTNKEAVKKNRMKTYKDPFEDENKDTNGIIKNSTDNIIQDNYFLDSQAFMPSFDFEQ